VKKSALYRQTFRRHRVLLTLPVAFALILAAWTSFGHPKTYEATASLWVDKPASAQSSLGNLNPAELPPAQQEQQVLMELLTTRSFMTAVADSSGLKQYLTTQASDGFGPTALLSKLTGAKSLQDRIVSALGPDRVLTITPGPQVLQISYTGATPALARSTLQEIVTGLERDSTNLGKRHNEVAVDYYRSQVQAASKTLSSLRDQIAAYARSHRGRGARDPSLAALQTAQGAASTQLNEANASLSQAAGAADAGSDGSAVHVLDAPTVPLGPTSGMKSHVMAILGGLFAGLVISFLAVVVLTPTRRDPWEDEPRPAAPRRGPVVGGGHAANGVEVRQPSAAWVSAGAGALFLAPEADRDSRDSP
jgi:uncharacterized protein involved in exopolysaccharide biosynthesis